MTAQHQLYIQAATSDNTRRTYRSAIRHFHRWGGALPCQSDTMIHYLLAYADQLNPRTLEVRLTALSQWHRYQGFDDPAQSPNVRKTLEGIKRKHGCPKRKAVALRLEHLAAMIDYLNQPPQTKKKARDLALLLIGFFGGFRRSELVAMETAHLQWEPEGIIIELPRSKTDQEGQGIKRAIPYGAGTSCPVHALKNWLEMAEIQQGVIFKPVSQWDTIQDRAMSPGAINNMLKVLGKACQSSRVGPHGTDPLTPRYVRCRIPRFQTGV
ncbi:MAG: tyrosine-type recombinase/integrase [Gammaproteobacteria bacterium]|nr:tyrosine-type recombinase/integrase [Gammaproteobacteria bacterium]